MDLYTFYESLNKKLLDEFKKIIQKNGETVTPLRVKKRLTDKLNVWMKSKDAPGMAEQEKRISVTVSRFPPNSYTIRTAYGVNKMFTMTKYDSLKNSFTQYITNEGKLSPKIDI